MVGCKLNCLLQIGGVPHVCDYIKYAEHHLVACLHPPSVGYEHGHSGEWPYQAGCKNQEKHHEKHRLENQKKRKGAKQEDKNRSRVRKRHGPHWSYVQMSYID